MSRLSIVPLPHPLPPPSNYLHTLALIHPERCTITQFFNYGITINQDTQLSSTLCPAFHFDITKIHNEHECFSNYTTSSKIACQSVEDEL
ncbi:hypothetical protein M422DRAFT_274812 [Sphaerobolus stellatus SS14]|uniref:Uncharacterized protein n=1 Tax=Sphaerobolus stellatus (strain SS14) TaxID=990650 RepID=A0A0C9UGX9_SPHS4|nr:hypothetical protein M422DRAFT_274812 [Sphaerobolus stellatus SS14]